MISDWRNYETWREAGSPTAYDTAEKIVAERLATFRRRRSSPNGSRRWKPSSPAARPRAARRRIFEAAVQRNGAAAAKTACVRLRRTDERTKARSRRIVRSALFPQEPRSRPCVAGARALEECMAKIIPVIMCGGSGTRMWPESRESLPKQFIPLIGERSTFQIDRAAWSATRRCSTARSSSPISTIASCVAEQLEGDRRRGGRFCSSRSGAISAAAVGAAARAWRRAQRSDAVVAVLAADHVVRDGKPSRSSARRRLPRRPARARSSPSASRPTIRRPDTATSAPARRSPAIRRCGGRALRREAGRRPRERFIEDGYLWNSGNFMFRADVMLEELQRFEPEIARRPPTAVASAEDGPRLRRRSTRMPSRTRRRPRSTTR